jgi:hypothetical protein
MILRSQSQFLHEVLRRVIYIFRAPRPKSKSDGGESVGQRGHAVRTSLVGGGIEQAAYRTGMEKDGRRSVRRG